MACLAYGVTSMVLFVALLPAELYLGYLAPQLHELDIPTGQAVLAPVARYWWFAIPVVELVITVFLTRVLGRRWAALCAAWVQDSATK